MSDGQWYRYIAERYASIAAASRNDLAKAANSAEAAKYYGIAARMEADRG